MHLEGGAYSLEYTVLTDAILQRITCHSGHISFIFFKSSMSTILILLKCKLGKPFFFFFFFCFFCLVRDLRKNC